MSLALKLRTLAQTALILAWGCGPSGDPTSSSLNLLGAPQDISNERCQGSIIDANSSSAYPKVDISWDLPSSDIEKVLVLRKTNSLVGPPGGMGVNPAHPQDPTAELIYFGPPIDTYEDLDVLANEFYYYGIWAYDSSSSDSVFSLDAAYCQAKPCCSSQELSPPDITEGSIVPGDSMACLNYEIPATSAVAAVRIYRKTSTPFMSPAHADPAASLVYEGSANSFKDLNLTNGTTYYYALYTLTAQGTLSATPLLLNVTPQIPNLDIEQTSKIVSPDLAPLSEFGSSVQLQGNLMLVAARRYDEPYTNAGKAYLYERATSSPSSPWTLIQTFEPSPPYLSNNFSWETAFSEDQSMIAISEGSYPSSIPSVNTRRVHLYRNQGGTFTLFQTLVPPPTPTNNSFGSAMVFTQDPATGHRILVVGDRSHNAPSSPVLGGVYIYEELTPGTFVQTALLTAQAFVQPFEHTSYANLGSTVAAYEGRVVAGAANRAFAIEKVSGQWEISEIATPPDLSNGDGFGYQGLSMMDHVLIIGASRTDLVSNGTFVQDAGAAYVYHRSPTGTWTYHSQITANDPLFGAHFGEAIAYNPTTYTLAMGASGTNSEGDATQVGALYLFQFDGNCASQVKKVSTDDISLGDRAFFQISLSGDTLVTGASFENASPLDVNEAGSVYTFDVSGVANLCTCATPPSNP